MKKIVLGLSLSVFSAVAMAGDPAAGQQKARSCAGCHGTQGISMAPIYPNLAGQKELYFISAMQAYKNQERKGGNAAVMWGIAAGLSDQDIKDLAAYYASLGTGS